ESNAETTDGDSLCASGSHVCKGASPILVPYPTRKKRNAASTQGTWSRAADRTRSATVKAVGALPPWEAATASRKLPSKAKAIPTEQISRYFQVASSERWCRWK